MTDFIIFTAAMTSDESIFSAFILFTDSFVN